MSKKVAIIGAGITGLASAYYFKHYNEDIDVTIFEATSRPGGKIQTYRRDGYTIELGPILLRSKNDHDRFSKRYRS